MRSLRTRGSSERKAMFANMMNRVYSPMSRFADKPKKSESETKIISEVIPEAKPISFEETISVSSDVPEKVSIPVSEVKHDYDVPIYTGIPVSEETIIEKAVTVPSTINNIVPLTMLDEYDFSPEIPKVGSWNRTDSESGPKMRNGPIQPQTLLLEGQFTKTDDSVGGRAYDNFFKEMKAGYGSAVKDLEKEIISKAGQYGHDIGSGKMEWDLAKGVVHMPGKILGPTGRSIKKLHIPEQAGKFLNKTLMVAAPAAEAFGATAGIGVTEALRETGDLISAPGREFFMPPGYQRVWSGEGNDYKVMKIETPQMQPVYMDTSAGVSMPPGVYENPTIRAEAAGGMMQAPIFRGIDDSDKQGEVSMGTLKASEVFERRRSGKDASSPNERLAKMNIFEAGKAFMGSSGGGRMQEAAKSPLTKYEKSDKQKRAEAIMSLSLTDAAKAFETGANVEVVGAKPKQVAQGYVPQTKSVSNRVVSSAPLSLDIPISSTPRHEEKPKSVSLPGAGGAVNRYIQDRSELQRARASGDVGAADRAEARMQSRIGGLKRSPTSGASAILAGMGGGR